MNIDFFLKRYLDVLMNDHSDHEFISIKMLTGGTTSHRIAKLLNFAVAQMAESECYLEVGVFLGTTLCSAAHINNRKCIGIDNYDPEMLGTMTESPPSQLRDRCLFNIKQFSPHITLIEKNFREVTKEEIGAPVAVSFIDGKHTYLEVRDNLTWLEPLLAKDAVLIFDDMNCVDVQRAVQERIGLYKENYDLLFYAKPNYGDSAYSWSLADRFLNNGVCVVRYHKE